MNPGDVLDVVIHLRRDLIPWHELEIP
jgi:hypothetical protein